MIMEVTMDNIVCNECGRILKSENGIVREEFVRVCKSWGYFSKKDGKTQEFIICEGCMEKLAQKFTIPVKEYDTVEMI